jgi:hypothetical protein
MLLVISSCANADDYEVVHFAMPMTATRARELLNMMDMMTALKVTNAAVWRLSAWDDSLTGYGFLDGITEDDLQELPDDALDAEERIAIDCGLVHVTAEGVTWEANERKTTIASQTVKPVTRAMLERWARPNDRKTDLHGDSTTACTSRHARHSSNTRDRYTSWRSSSTSSKTL